MYTAPPLPFSHSRICDQALSLTALWIGTTVFISTSFGSQFFRLMASKNICSDGYTQNFESFDPSAVGIELTTRLVSRGVACPCNGFCASSVGIWFFGDGHDDDAFRAAARFSWGTGHAADDCWCEAALEGLLSVLPITKQDKSQCQRTPMIDRQAKINPESAAPHGTLQLYLQTPCLWSRASFWPIFRRMSESSILENGSKPRLLLLGNRRYTPVPCCLWLNVRSGKSSIQRVVFHKMQPNLTLFLESTTKIMKDNIKYVHLVESGKLRVVRSSIFKFGISQDKSTFLTRRLI